MGPQRLVDFLATQSTTETGNYYETCEFVQEGAFGALEVTSNKAYAVFMERLDECKANLKYGGGGDWQYGPRLIRKTQSTSPAAMTSRPRCSTPSGTPRATLPAWARLRTRTTPTSELVPPKASRGYQPTHGTAIQSPITFCECWRKACTDLWPPPCSGAGLAAFAFDPAEAFAIARHTMASRD